MNSRPRDGHWAAEKVDNDSKSNLSNIIYELSSLLKPYRYKQYILQAYINAWDLD